MKKNNVPKKVKVNKTAKKKLISISYFESCEKKVNDLFKTYSVEFNTEGEYKDYYLLKKPNIRLNLCRVKGKSNLKDIDELVKALTLIFEIGSSETDSFVDSLKEYTGVTEKTVFSTIMARATHSGLVFNNYLKVINQITIALRDEAGADADVVKDEKIKNMVLIIIQLCQDKSMAEKIEAMLWQEKLNIVNLQDFERKPIEIIFEGKIKIKLIEGKLKDVVTFLLNKGINRADKAISCKNLMKGCEPENESLPNELHDYLKSNFKKYKKEDFVYIEKSILPLLNLKDAIFYYTADRRIFLNPLNSYIYE